MSRTHVGWFGVPGDMTGRNSTKTHAVDDTGKPICGFVKRHDSRYQHCGSLAALGVECKNCQRIMLAD